MKMMWMLAFTLLPLLAVAYISWHVWCLLPLSWIWKTLAIVLLAGSFLLMFAGIWRSTDRMPMTLAVAVYEIGTSSIPYYMVTGGRQAALPCSWWGCFSMVTCTTDTNTARN